LKSDLERLQKILSRCGYGSCRDCEKIISAGRVTINGKNAELGNKVNPLLDLIRVDGATINECNVKKIYIAFNKPRKVLSEIKKSDKRKIVTDYIPLNEYLFIVGRLDYDSEGLILLTNDGELADRLTHPRYGHSKEYLVQTIKPIEGSQLEIWRRGVILSDGYRTLPAKVEKWKSGKSNAWIRVILTEGKKRQIREMGNAIGLPIKRIIRTKIGNLSLGNLKAGEWRYLTNKEIKELGNI